MTTTAATSAAPSQPPESGPPRRPDLRPQFFLGLEDSSLVATDTLLQIKDTVVDTVELVLIALARGERSLRAQRMLATRTAGWPYIWPLTRDQIPQALPALHPVWQRVAPDDLKALDARIADGCLRRWVLLTLHTQRALVATGASKPDWDMLQAVADRVDGGRRP